jgi:ABC-type glycerol-3-phosphate transport system substrate-binding protein
MRWYADLSLVHQVKPAYGLGPFDDIDARQQLISQEQVAMWTTLGFDVGVSIPGHEALQIGIVPLPTSPEATASLSPASGFYISANTDKVQGCWEWIKFLTYQPNLSTGLPARRSVAESAAYAQSVGEEHALANLQSIENVTDSTAFRLYAGDNRWLSVGLTWLQQAYTEVINGEASVEQALETAQQTFDAYRACIIEGNGFSDTEVQDQCAAAVGQ